MKIGFFAIGIGTLTDPQPLRTIASHAERLGFMPKSEREIVARLERMARDFVEPAAKL